MGSHQLRFVEVRTLLCEIIIQMLYQHSPQSPCKLTKLGDAIVISYLQI